MASVRARRLNTAWKRRARRDPKYRSHEIANIVRCNRDRRNTPAGRLQKSIYSARKRAKKRGWAFDITLEDLGTPPKVCPVLGLKINYGPGGSMDPDRATIDRLDGRRGYVKGNVRVICYRANSLKSNATVKELRAVLRYMETNR